MKLERQYDQVTIGIFALYLVDIIFEESRNISVAFSWGSACKPTLVRVFH